MDREEKREEEEEEERLSGVLHITTTQPDICEERERECGRRRRQMLCEGERERVRCEIRFLLIASLSLGLQKYTLYTCFYVNFIFSSFSLTAVICYESLFSLFFFVTRYKVYSLVINSKPNIMAVRFLVWFFIFFVLKMYYHYSGIYII